MASAEAATGPDQTVVLKVSIHCHGCKKKVRKVLKSVEGVKNVTVDAAQHKVTVTGTIDAATLIKRLYKSGKQAHPWWQCHAPAEAAKSPAPAPEALPAPAAQPASSGDGGAKDGAAEKKPEETVKEPQAEGSEKKKKKPEEEAGASEKKPEAEPKKEEKEEAKKDGGDSEATEPKAKGAEAADATKEAGNEKEDANAKKSKPKDAGGAAQAHAHPVVMAERSLSGPPMAAPRHTYEEYYPQSHPYYSPQPPSVMSYNVAQRSASVSYFAPQSQPAYSMRQPEPQTAYPAYSVQQPQPQQAQPMQQWSPSYLYMPYQHSTPEPYYHDYYSPPGTHASPPPMQDSYRLFDDENPNSCSVM